MTSLVNNINFLTNSFGEKYLYTVNKNSFVKEKSSIVFDRVFKKLLLKKDTLYIITGSDSGLLIRYLVEKGIPVGSRYVFVEPDWLIHPIYQSLDDIVWSDRIVLVGPDAVIDQSMSFSIQDYFFAGKVEFVSSLGAIDYYLEEYRQLYLNLKTAYDDLNYNLSNTVGFKPFIERQFDNIIFNQTPVSKLQNSFKNMPAVILAGGPSLDEAVDWVKENQGNIVVIAVSRISRRLQEVGIIPDFVISVDPNPNSYRVSKEVLLFDSNVTLIHGNYANTRLISQWRGRQFYFEDRFPWDCKLNVDNVSDSFGSTVSNTALNFAHVLGCGPVFLAGLDFCFSKGGYTHAQGSYEHESGPRPGELGLQLETYDGAVAYTIPGYLNSYRSIQTQIDLYGDMDLYNVSGSSAKLNGVKWISLEEVKLEPLREEPNGIIDTCAGAFSTDTISIDLIKVKEELHDCRSKLLEVRKLVTKALNYNARLFGRTGSAPDFSFKNQLDDIEEKLDTKYKPFSDLIKKFNAVEFLKMPPRDREWQPEEIEEAGNVYYRAYLNGTNEIIDLVDGVSRKVHFFQDEVSEHPDIDALVDFWDGEEIPGRALLWQGRHENINLSPVQQSKMDEIAKSFYSSIEEKEDFGYGENILNPIRSKLQLLYRQNDLTGIHPIVEYLESVESNDHVMDLHDLAKGYICELEDNIDEALGFYLTIVDRSADLIQSGEKFDNPRLEDALLRMSDIFMSRNELDNVKLTLDALSALSEIYEPLFADFLVMVGEVQTGIDLYSEYIIRVPTDYNVMNKLARLYVDLEQKDSALWLVNHILENDPDNADASGLYTELNTDSR